MKFIFHDIVDNDDKELNIIRMKKLTIKPFEITALVGCNGSGKTISILQMIDQLRLKGFENIENEAEYNPFACLIKDKTPPAGYYVHFNKNAEFSQSSEIINGPDMKRCFRNIMFSTGEGVVDRANAFMKALKICGEKAHKIAVPIFVFVDDFDVGVSIDVMLDMRRLLDEFFVWCKKYNIQAYVVLSSNSYDLIQGYRCVYPGNGQEYIFNSYDDFKHFVLFSRAEKDKR